MGFDITIWGALIAGLISFLSPCVLPLVPAYLGFLGGTTIDQLTGEGDGKDSIDTWVLRFLVVAGLMLLFGKLLPALLLGWVLPHILDLPTLANVTPIIISIGKILLWTAFAIAISLIIFGLVTFKGAKRRVLLASVFFVLGLTAVFVSLGAAASFIGGFIAQYKNELGIVAGVLIIIFGLHFLGILKIPLLYRSAKIDVQMESASFIGAFMMGMAFAFGWTPCVGPVLAPILTLAGNSETIFQGVGLLFVYAMGLGIPFILAALAITPFMGFMAKFRKHMSTVEKVMGLLLIITGILFISGSLGYFGINSIGVFILDFFPSLASLG